MAGSMKFEIGQQVFFLADNLLWRGFVEHEEDDVVLVKATYKTEEGRVYVASSINPKLVFKESQDAVRFLRQNLNNPFALQSENKFVG